MKHEQIYIGHRNRLLHQVFYQLHPSDKDMLLEALMDILHLSLMRVEYLLEDQLEDYEA